MATMNPRVRLRDYLRRFGLILSFALLCLVLALLSDRFLTAGNISNILLYSAINGIISVGMTLVILTAGLDLSVGAIVALAALVAASAVQQYGSTPLAILICLLIGTAIGATNGLLTVGLRIPPFISTLGMMTISRGLALTFSRGEPITGFPASFRLLGAGRLGPVPVPIIVMAIVFLLGYLLLARTTPGEYVRALGNSPVAARMSGVRTRRVTVVVYLISGLLSALAGLLLIGRLDSAAPTLGTGYEFDAIAAVVVGGTSFTGGEGGLGGTLLGVLIISVINNGLNLLNINALWNQVVKGLVIALALLIYRSSR
jgi:ribose transport system permease protein